jgi:hypothetical protein
MLLTVTIEPGQHSFEGAKQERSFGPQEWHRVEVSAGDEVLQAFNFNFDGSR